MARVRTVGFEAQGFSSNASLYTQYFEGFTAGTVTSSSSVVRSGGANGRSMKCDSGGGNAVADAKLYIPPSVTSAGAWARCYFRFESTMPSASSTTLIQIVAPASAALVSARLTSGGKLQLWNDTGTPAQIGSDSSATLVADTWYRIELKCLVIAAGNDTVELQIDGVSVASSTLALSASDSEFIFIGFITAPGASKVCYLDDFACNDNTGSSQTSWPGAGNVVLLKPISDNTVGSWLAGAGGSSNLFDAVDNTPPAGLDDASMTNTSQIKNNTSGGGTDYVANMTTYTDAGITSGDTITLCHPIADTGENTATGTKLGTFKIASNPVGSDVDGFVFGSLLGSAACGTWPVSWGAYGTTPTGVVYSPSVTLGSSPTMSVHRSTASTAFVSFDFIGIYVDYIAAVAGQLASKPIIISQAVNRAGAY